MQLKNNLFWSAILMCINGSVIDNLDKKMATLTQSPQTAISNNYDNFNTPANRYL